jgi:hypothetical protein
MEQPVVLGSSTIVGYKIGGNEYHILIQSIKPKEGMISQIFTLQGPKSLLEVWAGSHNINFHCDFGNFFWRCNNVLTSWEYNFFSPGL